MAEKAAAFDSCTALFMAAVCEQSYVQYYNPTGAFLVPTGYRTIGKFKAQAYESKPEYFGFLIESDRVAVLAFRGTRSTMDWVSDFISQQIIYKPGKPKCLSHKGFTDIYASCREQVIELVKTIDPSKQLFVTGHSLGGALATLAAFDIAFNLEREPIVYTFGAPRVGDPRFARLYNKLVKQHWRIQNEYDIVPHLPPLVYRQPKTKKIFYYMHVRGEVKRSFRMGSVFGNHVLRSYFADLAKDDPAYAAALCASPIGWCPPPPDPPPAEE
ncbi:lipase family protein [Paenibacillus xylaniclasticus]|uniref:lipase family protein n=1 Tax=Paenibacillus xylaniclasticus TaxID=588083 RepID=UPI000FDCAAFC|nr:MULTISPECIES: lipase family protein [Paenibacillus]GFN33087.1 lipase [Paenibacillus curdlanolyticus]